MLPKPEKPSKKTAEQLDLVETISDADKLKKKRSSIIIFLLLTVGLSLAFIIYRSFKDFSFSQITLPSLSLKLPTLPQSKFTPDVPPSWSFEILPSGTTSNFKNINPSPYAKRLLPDGVKVVEKLNPSPDSLEIFSDISTPKFSFQVLTKIPGNISDTSPETDTYAKLISSYYWYLLKSLE